MKKKFLLFLICLSIVIALTACNQVTLPTLDAPTGVTVTDSVLHWNSVNGANTYIVNRDGVDIATVSDVQYPLTGLTAGTTYVFKVKAKHNLGVYNDSAYSETYSYVSDGRSALSSPSNITINDGVITWDAVDNATSYIVSINGTDYTSTKNELSLPSLTDGVYSLKVKAVGDGQDYSASVFSKEMTVDLYDGSVCTNEQFGNFKDLNQFESFLGYGFDVIADSVVSDRTVLTSFPIFNVDELMGLRFLKVNSKSSQVKVISEDNMESFSEQWNSALNVNVSTSVSYSSVKVGGSLKLKSEYSVASSSAKSTYYYCITISDQKFYIVMQGDMDTYRGMLSNGFEKDLYDRNVDPAMLFQRYGTHFITSAVMGGRMNAFYNMYSLEEETSAQQYTEVAAAISTSFSSMFSFSLDTEISFNSNIETAKSKHKINTKESVDVMGGADFGIASISQVPGLYADWQKSLDTYPSLMGIKDSSSLIGIWELLDRSRDTSDDWTWIDENGEEQHGTRAQQLQAYFYKYGLENYNQLMVASSLPETVKPAAIGNVLINGNGAGRDGYYNVDADSVNAISFTVLPDNAVGYTKSYSLSEESKEYAYIENGELVVRPASAIPSDTVLYLTVSAGNAQKTLRLRVIRKYNVSYHLNFTTDYTIANTYGVLEGSAISPPVLMSKEDGSINDVAIERFGYRLIGWASYSGGEYVIYDFSKPVTSNLDLFAQWQKITNIVTIDAQGGTFENGQTSLTHIVDYNDYVERPEANPTRDHYEFMGWFTEKNGIIPFDFEDTHILKKTTVYAKWVAKQYTVTVNLENGTASDKAYTSAENNFAISLNNPTKLYYDFAYWALSDGTEIDLSNYQFKQNTTIKAVYTPTLYTVTFNTDGGSAVAPMATSVETSFLLNSQVPTPEKTGYTFRAWRVYVNNNYEELADLSSITIKADIVVTALYTVNKYTVTFNSNGGNAVASYNNINHGRIIPAPTAPEKSGYKFVGWYTDSSLEKRFSFEADTITSNITLYAAWTENLLYTVTFITNIPDKAFEPIIVEMNTVLSSRYTDDINADYEGHRFDGWFTDENFNNFFNPTMPINENVVLYAKWVALPFKVEFMDGDNVLDSKIYSCGEQIIVPSNPQKEGYTFVDWLSEIPQYMPAKDLKIYANFAVNSYSIVYRLTDGEEVYREKSFAYGTTVNFNVNDPEKTGYEFVSWDIELPVTMPAHDVVITAQWNVKTYKITFYLSSSTDVYTEKYAEREVAYGSVLAEVDIDEPKTADGEEFKGWNFGGAITMPAENIDAFAIFERVTVKLTLIYGNNRQTVNAVYRTNLSEAFAEVELKDNTYLYDGTWSTANGLQVSADATVPSKDTTYYANYSVRKTTFTHTGLTITDKLIVTDSGSLYLTLSDLPALNAEVLNSVCGSITLDISFDSNQDIIFDIISGSNTVYTVTTGTSSGTKSFKYSVKVSYQHLVNGMQLKFTENCNSMLNVIISNVKIDVTAANDYCVDLNGKLYFFDNIDGVNNIAYNVPSKANTTEVATTSPTRVYRTVSYTFDKWKVGSSEVTVINNKFQLSHYFTNTHRVTVVANYLKSYSAYSANMKTLTATYNGTITDDSQDAFVKFETGDIKSMLSTYNLRVTIIDISVYIKEIHDGYQEIYFAKNWKSGWKNHTHVFNDGDLIYSYDKINTVSGSRGEGRFNASQNVNYNGSNMPSWFVMYFGANGKYEDDYTVSDISITLHFAN